MAELTALIARLKAPIFSIKQPEAFQVGAALPLPQPSTLAGALAYCIAIKEGLERKNLIKKVQSILKAARACLASEVAVPSPIVLRRFRVLDKGMERKEGKLPDYEIFENAYRQLKYDIIHRVLERLSDALYREYVFVTELTCVWIIEGKLPADLLWTINHLGDTESTCSVVQVDQVSATRTEESEIRTKFQAPILGKVVVKSGTYLLAKMQSETFWHREGGELLTYIVPCEERVERGAKGLKYRVYKPTEITLSYDRPVGVYSFEFKGCRENLVEGKT